MSEEARTAVETPHRKGSVEKDTDYLINMVQAQASIALRLGALKEYVHMRKEEGLTFEIVRKIDKLLRDSRLSADQIEKMIPAFFHFMNALSAVIDNLRLKLENP